MDLERQILFFFSALGAFNGFILSIYFAFFSKQKHISNYFLSILLFVISIRIIKSVFLFFNADLSELYIQIGLSACFLIGPFLYFYVKSKVKESTSINRTWLYHVAPILVAIAITGFVYPYKEHRALWVIYFIRVIYLQWLIYIVLSGFYIKDILRKLFIKEKKINDIEIWILSIFFGITIIWIGYVIGSYASYIVGALSFSFVYYLLMLLWFFKKNKNSIFFDQQIKYANRKIDEAEATSIGIALEKLINDNKLYKNPNLKLSDIAKKLDVLPYHLSQFLNDNLGKSFSVFINEYRIKEAEEMLKANHLLTIEAIGYECGFKSNSTFYSTFKKIKGITPAKFKKEID